MQIAWLIAVIAGLAAGVLLVRFRASGRGGQRGLRSPAGASRRFTPHRHPFADLAFFHSRSITGVGFMLGMALLIGVGLVTIVWLPARLVPAGVNFPHGDRVRAVNDLRGMLLQAFVVLGAVIAAARTWRVVTERGQHTERLTATVEQLTHPHVQLRLTAIFALEQLARDSRRDRAAIAEILCGYVRTCSPWPPCRPGQYVEHAPIQQLLPLDRRAAEVQAAMTVLGRGPFFDRRCPLQLTNVDLRVAILDGADLSGAHLAGTNLQHARLHGIRLPGASLEGANLQRVWLDQANLQGAVLTGANLQAASLRGATLQGIVLDGADLQGADLTGADLRGGILPRAKLQRARLNQASLRTATLDEANLQRTCLNQADLQGVSLNGADLRSASLEGALIRNAKLRGASLNQAKLKGAILEQADMQGATLKRAILDHADLQRATLDDTDLERARCLRRGSTRPACGGPGSTARTCVEQASGGRGCRRPASKTRSLMGPTCEGRR
jgi:uncharacterized protein YjbI with pentapeptide repeats